MSDVTELERVFDTARALPAGAEREAYLREACGDDADLRAQLDVLLRFDLEADDAFGGPDELRADSDGDSEAASRVLEGLRNRRDARSGVASSVLSSLKGRLGDSLSVQLDGPQDEEASVHLPDEVEGLRDSSSRYRLLGELGRGGMGVVLKGRDQDLGRDVALKVLHEDRARRGDVLARFVEEAQIGGQLQHPGIVPVHELGLDADDRVYFSMKLVKGRNLAEVFRLVREEREGWTRTRVLGVLLKVCEAMAYAHARGVIHRDLKPSNIMVGRYGETYVTDWGLARILGRPERKDIRVRPEAESMTLVRSDWRGDGAGGDAVLTMDGDVLGTPSFMSPEQARGELDRMGPASDVYALGAILYQLLAGHMPYRPEGSRRNAYAIWGLVQEEPPSPIAELARDAAPELVSICEKAMARDPDERYPDMSELADDLRAFLEDRVVAAHRTGPVIEMRKWVQRNRSLAATAAALVALALGGSTTAAVVLAAKNETIRLARDEALEARELADAAARKEADLRAQADEARVSAEGVTDFLIRQIESLGPDELRGRPLDVVDLLDRMAGELESGLAESPLGRARLATALGRAYFGMARMERAESLLKGGLAQNAALLGDEHPHTLEAMRHLVNFLCVGYRFEEAEPMALELFERSERVLGSDHRETLASSFDLAHIEGTLGRADEATARLRRGVERSEKLFGRGAETTASGLQRLAHLLLVGRSPDVEEAERILREVAEWSALEYGEDSPKTMSRKGNHATALIYVQRHGEAELILTELVDAVERVLGKLTPIYVGTLSKLAEVHFQQGRLEEAERHTLEVLEAHRRRAAEDHVLPEFILLSVDTLGRIRQRQGRLAEAEELWLQGIAMARDGKGRWFERTRVPSFEFRLGAMYRDQRRWAEAEERLLSALPYSEGRPSYSNWTRTIERLYTLWVEALEADTETDPRLVLVVRSRRAAFWANTDRLGQAEHALRGIEDALSDLFDDRLELEGEAHPDTLATLHALADVVALRDANEAEGLFAECLAGRQRGLGESHADTLATLEALVRLCASEERWAAAERHATELLVLTPEDAPEREQRAQLLEKIDARDTDG
jgi:tetratricopeptide (TPR) repeat protein